MKVKIEHAQNPDDDNPFESLEASELQPRRKGRPKGPSGKITLNARVTFRCTPQEKNWLESQAKSKQLSLGDWLRHHIVKKEH